MSVIEIHVQDYEFNRQRTLDLLGKIEQEPDPAAILGWRPGPGRAHIAWQLMHTGITEEIFATERLNPEMQPSWQELWPRFRGGSTPDDGIPSSSQIREVLNSSRQHLLETLRGYTDDRLDEVPPALAQRGWTFRIVLSVLSWHESHHHGQAHITFNLYKAKQSS